MLIRIVRMSFAQENVKDFLDLFGEVKPKIENFPGCESVALKQDAEHKNIFYTHSTWEDKAALESYRKSDFFKETWSKTKPLFNDRPRAYSLIDLE